MTDANLHQKRPVGKKEKEKRGNGTIWSAEHRLGSKVISNSNLPRWCSALH